MNTLTFDRKQATRRWSVDPARSTVEFSVRHLWGLSTVSGRFDRFSGYYIDDPEHRQIELTVDAASVDTGSSSRDEHLQSPDFFLVAVDPQIRFASTRIVGAGDGILHVSGELAAAGTTVPLEFDATVLPHDDELTVEATTTVDQRQLGMTWSPLGSVRAPATVHVRARLT